MSPTKFNPLAKKGFDKIGDTAGLVSDTAYGASWDNVTDVAPSKNAVYDKIQTLAGGHDAVTLDANADTLLSLSTQELGLDTQVANKIFAGPDSGADAVPTFRALVAADIPDLSGTYMAVGSVTQYTDEMAQDAVGGVIGTGLSYDDSTGVISCTITQYEDADAVAAVGTPWTSEGYLTEETDPVFSAWDKSTGISITESQISDLGTYSTDIHTNIVALNAVSGINTGDQDLSGYLKLDATNYDSVIFPDGKYVGIDQIRARDGDGLKLTDDGNNGIFIKDGGNVGIGTTNPLANLDIKTAGGFTRGLKIGPQTKDTGDGSYIEFITSNEDGYGPQIGGIRTGSGGIGDLIIKTGGNSQQERMRITNTGNVDIGTPTTAVPTLTLGRASGQATIKATTASSGYLIMDSNGGELRLNSYVTDNVILAYGGGSVGAGVTPVVQLDVAGSATNGKSLQVRSGDGATGTDSNQIIFSYNNKPYNSGGYAHAIKTTHDNSSAAGNTISFWLRDHGTDDANTIGTKKVLELNGAGLVYAPTKIQVGSASSALTGEVLKGAYNGVTVSSPIGLGIENTGTSGSGQGAGSVWYSNDGAAMSSGDRLGFLLFGGSSSASALRNTGGILAYATQNWTDGSAYGTKISIETTDNNATSRTETVSFRGTLAYFSGEVSAFSFTDRTPSYEGDALSALSKIKSKNGQIDHSTLPKEARVIKEVSKNIYKKGVMVGQEIVEEEGRDLGMMISILTKAVQQLRSEVNILKQVK